MILANPMLTQGEVAMALGYTESWVSMIINSDAFQQELKERDDQIFEEVVIPLRKKLEGVAHRAVERLGERLEDEDAEGNFILSVADKMLHRLGYAPTKGPTVVMDNSAPMQNNFYSVDTNVLAAARAALLQRGGDCARSDGAVLPAPARVLPGAECGLGAGSASGAELYREEARSGQEVRGLAVREEGAEIPGDEV